MSFGTPFKRIDHGKVKNRNFFGRKKNRSLGYLLEPIEPLRSRPFRGGKKKQRHFTCYLCTGVVA